MKALKDYKSSAELAFYKVIYYYYFDFHEVENGVAEANLKIMELLTPEQFLMIQTRRSKDITYII